LILVDANLPLYAEDSLSPLHALALKWWDEQLSGTGEVGLSWPTLNAFLRISTNARLLPRPLALAEASERIESWLAQPCVRLVGPTDEHWTIFQRMLRAGAAVANLLPDAHLAALAVEHNCELCSTDGDFARFPGLKWRNPLAAPKFS
jgi:toxin-antitoxin system PIN domain toxin